MLKNLKSIVLVLGVCKILCKQCHMSSPPILKIYLHGDAIIPKFMI